MINTSACEFCSYGTIDETNKAKILVHCSLKDKTYIYGQNISCEPTERKKEENND